MTTEEDRLMEAREALADFAEGLRSGRREDFLRTIRRVGEGDFEEFRSVLADLAVERHALEEEFRARFGLSVGAAISLNTGPSLTATEARDAAISVEGETARAELAGGPVFRLVREEGRWVVDWPADAMGEGGEENGLLRRWTAILRRHRELAGAEGSDGGQLLAGLAFALIGAVAEEAGPEGMRREDWGSPPEW